MPEISYFYLPSRVLNKQKWLQKKMIGPRFVDLCLIWYLLTCDRISKQETQSFGQKKENEKFVLRVVFIAFKTYSIYASNCE